MKELLTQRDDIFVIRNFLTFAECELEIARCENIGFSDAPILTPSGPVVNKGMRNNTRVIIDDFNIAAKMYEKVKEYLPESYLNPTGVNERFRYYRYEPGQFFDWHFDAPYKTSRLTFMVYLNDGFTGGETVFHLGETWQEGNTISVIPEQGMALLFTHNVLHRGATVNSGKKYVMRSDIMY